MIRVLPPDVANKIAAGEVIERPASVVKELVENALDAGAKRLRVEAEEGGKRLIRVIDDGAGMSPEDLGLAFLPHATSKIASAEDLFQVASYGFRGEALPSIGSVARCRVVTRRPEDALGAEIACEGGALSTPAAAGAAVGTAFEVRDLFFNTPVRRKFLKGDSAEVASIAESLTRLVMPHEELGLAFHHNGREVMRCDPAPSFEARLREIFGREVKGSLIPLGIEHAGLRVDGFVSKPEAATARASRQYAFLNGRFIRDKSITAAVAKAFEGYLMPRRFPMFFLRLALDPALVDVNVHPTKIEVRFRDREAVFVAVFRACRTALDGFHGAPPLRSVGAVDSSAGSVSAVKEERSAEALLPGFQTRDGAAVPATRFAELRRIERSLYPTGVPEGRETVARSTAGSCARPAEPEAVHLGAPARFLQIHRSYILVESADGLSIIDQHALHERLLFDRLTDASRPADSQPLLVPCVLDLAPAERECLRGLSDELKEIGLVVADFGRMSLAIHEVPVDLAHADPERLARAALKLEDEKAATGFSDIRRALRAGLACKAAVKFNDRLPDEEIRALLAWHAANPTSAACPHGRPVRLHMSLADLEQRFLRKA